MKNKENKKKKEIIVIIINRANKIRIESLTRGKIPIFPLHVCRNHECIYLKRNPLIKLRNRVDPTG